METLWIIAISVAVAAFIGGITNHFAIKMLFHPRYERSILGWKLPFTPGLIPKRREEIAASLGKVVAEYLVTSHGLSELLRKESFRRSIGDKLSASLRGLSESEETIIGYAGRLWPELGQEDGRERLVESLSELLGDISRRGLQWWWSEKGGSRLTTGELLKSWPEERKEELVRKAAGYILEAARKELYSPSGERLLLKLTTRLIEQAGGFLGAMASIFMDESKVAAKVRQALSEALDGPAVRNALVSFVRGQWDKAERMTMGEWAELVSGGASSSRSSSSGSLSSGEDLLNRIADSFRWEEWIRRLGEWKMNDLLNGHVEWLEEKIPGFVAIVLNLVERNAERIFAAVRLEDMVEAQVRNFPIERIEQIILSVSGREFRAITWLGALLGGVIGLVQAVLIRWIA